MSNMDYAEFTDPTPSESMTSEKTSEIASKMSPFLASSVMCELYSHIWMLHIHNRNGRGFNPPVPPCMTLKTAAGERPVADAQLFKLVS